MNRTTLKGLPRFCRDHASPTKPGWTKTNPSFCLPLLLPYRQDTGESHVLRQAVRSLGPRSCACYQASTRGLSTRSSPWDLDALSQERGKTHLGGGFALRCFQRFSFLDVAFQPWGGHPNWRTSGRAISVLSYWR